MTDTLPNTSDRWVAVILVEWTWETHTDSQGQSLNHPSMRSTILLGSSILLIGSPVTLANCVTVATSHNIITPLVVIMLTV